MLSRSDPIHVADWGYWPKHLRFHTTRFTEFDSTRYWNSWAHLRSCPDIKARGVIIYRIHHTGRYVPCGWFKPKTKGANSGLRNRRPLD